MFKNFKLAGLFVLAIMLVTLNSCKDDEDNSLLVQAEADADLSIFVAAMAKAGLTSTLESSGPITVFTPTNDAFDAFLTANGFTGLDDVPVSLLTSVLTNHVVSGENRSSSLSTGYVKTLSASAADPDNTLSLYINTTDGVVLNGVSTVTTADIGADNGVIHKVNAVIGLPTVVTHAAANAEFTNLVAALTVDNTSINYVSTLSSPGPYTVFAPTNAAFSSFVVEKGFAGLDAIPVATLETVLQYHVLSGTNVNSADITDGLSPTTLEGTTFTINTTGGVTITDNEGRVTNVIVTDVQANNGIIHVVDKVLSPL